MDGVEVCVAVRVGVPVDVAVIVDVIVGVDVWVDVLRGSDQGARRNSYLSMGDSRTMQLSNATAGRRNTYGVGVGVCVDVDVGVEVCVDDGVGCIGARATPRKTAVEGAV